jgi:ketosteroid isomerase-like protein
MTEVSTNSELLLAGYDAWNREDCDAWLRLLTPDVVISTSGVFPDLSAEYCGHGEATRFWRQMHAPWEKFRIEVEHVEDDGDYAFAAIRFRGKGIDSGIEVDMRFGMAIRVRDDGLATHLVNRRTLDEAREVLKHKERETAGSPA